MPAPTNVTYDTAVEILLSDCPYINTQDVHDAGTTYNVWYKITNDLGYDSVITGWFYGIIPSGSNYHPSFELYFDPAGANEFYGSSFPNCPYQLPLANGATVYVKVVSNSGTISPAVLNINVTVKPTQQAIVAGQIFIPGASILFDIQAEQGGIYAGFINSSTEEIVNFLPFFPVSEWGDILNSGVSAYIDAYQITLPAPSAGHEYVIIYNTNFQLIARTEILLGNTSGLLRTCNGTNRFVAISTGGGGAYLHYYFISEDGTIVSDSEITGSAGCSAHAATNDEAYLYVSGIGSSLLDAYSTIKKWNTSLLSWESDFVAYLAGYRVNDILVLSDDKVVVLYQKKASPYDLIIKIFSSDGTLIDTYTPTYTTSLSSSTKARLGYSADNPTHFWLWAHKSNGFAVARKVIVDTGAYAYNSTTPDIIESEIESATPSLIYTSDTCPIIETRAGVTPPPTPNIGSGIYKIVPGKRNDTLWNDDWTTTDVKIPNPYGTSGLIGD